MLSLIVNVGVRVSVDNNDPLDELSAYVTHIVTHIRNTQTQAFDAHSRKMLASFFRLWENDVQVDDGNRFPYDILICTNRTKEAISTNFSLYIRINVK